MYLVILLKCAKCYLCAKMWPVLMLDLKGWVVREANQFGVQKVSRKLRDHNMQHP